MLLRVIKNTHKGGVENNIIQTAMMRSYLNDAVDKVAKCGKEAINAFAEGDEQKMMLLGLKRFTKTQPFNSKAARRLIADKLIEDARYGM